MISLLIIKYDVSSSMNSVILIVFAMVPVSFIAAGLRELIKEFSIAYKRNFG